MKPNRYRIMAFFLLMQGNLIWSLQSEAHSETNSKAEHKSNAEIDNAPRICKRKSKKSEFTHERSPTSVDFASKLNQMTLHDDPMGSSLPPAEPEKATDEITQTLKP